MRKLWGARLDMALAPEGEFGGAVPSALYHDTCDDCDCKCKPQT